MNSHGQGWGFSGDFYVQRPRPVSARLQNRPSSCSLGAGLGELPAAGSPGRQALAQLRVSTLIYISTHPAELSLALAELYPPKHM